MLRKLLKYDLKWSLQIIAVFLGLGVFFAVCGRLLDFAPDSLFFDVVIGICKGASLSLTITGLVNAILRSWIRFILNSYKDESYLTNTLPVERSTIYLSKVINALICILISLITLAVNLFIMYYSKETIDLIKTSISTMSNVLDTSVVELLILVFIALLAEVIYITICGMFGIIFGYSNNQKKLISSFVYGFAVYMIVSFLSLIIALIGSAFNESLKSIILGGTTIIDYSLLKVILIVAILLSVVCSLALYFISLRKYKEGINID